MTHDDDRGHGTGADLSRRKFLRGAGTVAAGSFVAPALIGANARASSSEPNVLAEPAGDVVEHAGEVDLVLDVDGVERRVKVEPRTTLLDALRVHCEPAVTTPKLVCDRGNCGACTVLVDGAPRYACLQLALDLRGKKIRTAAGLGDGTQPTPLQESFVAHDASMCGFCTPGFVASISACLRQNPRASRDEIRASCAGNVCRCGTYPQIFEAALATVERLDGASPR